MSRVKNGPVLNWEQPGEYLFDLTETRFWRVDGLSIRSVEDGDGSDDALLLSPWPESLLAFEPMWSRLAEHAHLVAIDLPGFGHSERRNALMSPRAMEILIRVADAFRLDSPHVVGPDIGTGASLFAAVLALAGCAASSSGVEARPFPCSSAGC
jgi:pimeloyl-ACP methyl ester carboxylesterase